MNYSLSRQVRRFVGRLSKREDIRSGTIRALGVLRHVALQTYESDQGYTTQLDVESTFELTSLEGNISMLGEQIVLNCYVQVSTRQLGQWQVFGGRLYEAEAIAVEFVVEVFDDLVLERRLDARVGLPTWERIETVDAAEPDGELDAVAPVRAINPPPEPALQIPGPSPKLDDPKIDSPKVDSPAPAAISTARAQVFSTEEGVASRPSTPEVVRRRAPKPVAAEPAPGPKPNNSVASDDSTWADAVKASERVRTVNKLAVDTPKASKKAQMDDWPDTPELAPGDLLNHPHFGLCKVVYLEEDDYVRVRMRSGKVLDIKLEVCKITRSGEQDGKPLFDCKIVGR
jgi:predicted DNA-binding protein with PD1-like motif